MLSMGTIVQSTIESVFIDGNELMQYTWSCHLHAVCVKMERLCKACIGIPIEIAKFLIVLCIIMLHELLKLVQEITTSAARQAVTNI